MSNTNHRFAEQEYRDRLFDLVSADTEWLDLGCGHQLLPGWLKGADQDQQQLSRRCKQLTGIDASADDVARHPYLHSRVVGDLHRLPFPDNTFTLLTARSVVEHVERPAEFLREIHRVLKPNGRFLFSTPNYFYYQFLLTSLVPDAIIRRLVSFLEGRQEGDVFKTYYRMNTVSRTVKLARAADFAVELLETTESLPEFGPLGHPIVDLEKAFTALLRLRCFRNFRAVTVGVLRKPAAGGDGQPEPELTALRGNRQ